MRCNRISPKYAGLYCTRQGRHVSKQLLSTGATNVTRLQQTTVAAPHLLNGSSAHSSPPEVGSLPAPFFNNSLVIDNDTPGYLQDQEVGSKPYSLTASTAPAAAPQLQNTSSSTNTTSSTNNASTAGAGGGTASGPGIAATSAAPSPSPAAAPTATPANSSNAPPAASPSTPANSSSASPAAAPRATPANSSSAAPAASPSPVPATASGATPSSSTSAVPTNATLGSSPSIARGSNSSSNSTTPGAAPAPSRGPGSFLDANVFGGSTPWTFSNATFNSSGRNTSNATPAPSVQDPEPYDYPPVGPYPTVFFTAVMQDFSSPDQFDKDVQASYSSAMNGFLSADDKASRTSILGSRMGSAGLWVATSVQLTNRDANLPAYLATTIQADLNLVYPEAVWGPMRAVNIRNVAATTPAKAFTWRKGDYTECSVLCGGGFQYRNVTCFDEISGNIAPSGNCPSNMPDTNRTCNTRPCNSSRPQNFGLVFGTWGTCNSTCGPGHMTRPVTCQSQDGFLGDLAQCEVNPSGLLQQISTTCSDQPACPSAYWQYSDWTCTADAGCGPGMAARTATCVSGAPPNPVDPANCSGLVQDTTSQPCALAPCVTYYWRSSELGDCQPEYADAPCGRYVQVRRFDCVNVNTGEVVAARFCPADKPNLGNPECATPDTCQQQQAPPTTPIDPLNPFGMPDPNAGGTITMPQPNPGAVDTSTPPAAATEATQQQPQPAGGLSNSTPPAGQQPAAGGVSGAGGTTTTSSSSSSSSGGGGTTSTAVTTSDSSASTSTSSSSSTPPSTAASGSSSNGSIAASSRGIKSVAGGQPAAGSPSTAVAAHQADNSRAAHSSSQTWFGGFQAAETSSSSSSSSSSSDANTAARLVGTTSVQISSSAGVPPSTSNTNSVSNAGGTLDSMQQSALSGFPFTPISSGYIGSSSSEVALAASLGHGSSQSTSVDAWKTTAEFKAVQQCPDGVAISVNGQCCTAGSQLDANGNCCNGAKVDACGICNGTALTIDSLGGCCNGTLDAGGYCCNGVVDECGVCNGVGACNVRALLLASLPNAPLYLMVNSNPNKKLRDLIQVALASALSSVQSRPFDKSHVSVVLGAVAKSTKSGSKGTWTVVAATKASEAPVSNSSSGSGGIVGSSNVTVLDLGTVRAMEQPLVQGSSNSTASVPNKRAGAIPWGGLIDTPAPDVFSWKPVSTDTQSPGKSSSNSTTSNSTAAVPSFSPSPGLLGATTGRPGSSNSSTTLVAATTAAGGPAAGAGASSSEHLPAKPTRRVLSDLVAASEVSPSTLSSSELARAQQQQGGTRGPQPLASATGATSPKPGGSGATQVPSPAPAATGGTTAGSTTSPPPAATPSPPPATLSTSALANINSTATTNNVLIDVLLRNVDAGVRIVPDTATVLMALYQALKAPVPLPASKNVLRLEQVLSISRTGTCGDGVCQVNERETVDNPDSCHSDCPMPYLTCPPYSTSSPACNGMGACYNSIGACSCFMGYKGTDCSSCASGYKRIHDQCVSLSYLTASLNRGCVGASCYRASRTNPALAVDLDTEQQGDRGPMIAVVTVFVVSTVIVGSAGVAIFKWRQGTITASYGTYLQTLANVATD